MAKPSSLEFGPNPAPAGVIKTVMHSRLIISLLCAAALAFACGPRSQSTATTPGAARDVNGPPIASSLNVSVKDNISFAFHVTNNSDKKLELVFPSGQTFEIVVTDALGREMWRASQDRMYTQALQSKVLDGNETVTYSASFKDTMGPGKYLAVATLKSSNHPLEKRVEFSLP